MVIASSPFGSRSGTAIIDFFFFFPRRGSSRQLAMFSQSKLYSTNLHKVMPKVRARGWDKSYNCLCTQGTAHRVWRCTQSTMVATVFTDGESEVDWSRHCWRWHVLGLPIFLLFPSRDLINGDTQRSPANWELNNPLVSLDNYPPSPKCKALSNGKAQLFCWCWSQNEVSYFLYYINTLSRCACTERGNESPLHISLQESHNQGERHWWTDPYFPGM